MPLHIHSILAYVRSHTPDVIILEAVDVGAEAEGGKDVALAAVVGLLQGAGYEAQPFLADAADYGLPCKRVRGYVLAVWRASPLGAFGAADSAGAEYERFFASVMRYAATAHTAGPSLEAVVARTVREDYIARQLAVRQEAGPGRDAPGFEAQLLAYCRRAGLRVPSVAADDVGWRALLTGKQRAVLRVAEAQAQASGARAGDARAGEGARCGAAACNGIFVDLAQGVVGITMYRVSVPGLP